MRYQSAMVLRCCNEHKSHRLDTIYCCQKMVMKWEVGEFKSEPRDFPSYSETLINAFAHIRNDADSFNDLRKIFSRMLPR